MSHINNPFPGLRPFSGEESDLFFGRERHVGEITRKLNVFRFVSVVGNSGSGKSSLVRAGLLPQLEKNETPEGGKWKVCLMRPGENPLVQLHSALHKSFREKFSSTVTEAEKKVEIETLGRNKLGLIQFARPLIDSKDRLLLIVDQFEELFRFGSHYDPDQSQSEAHLTQHFVNLLLEAIGQKDVPIYVMLTLRSDFLGDCEQFMGLPEAINDGQFLVPRMNREELQRSLTGPIQHSGGKITPRLVQQLLNEIGNNPDQLPILQHVLMRTWEVWNDEGTPEKPIDIVHYEKTGGMDKALSNHAEEAFAELDKQKEQGVAEVMFKAITLKGQDNRGIRRPTPVMRIVNIAESDLNTIQNVASVFRHPDRGFIMPPHNIPLTEESILDISHESLMRVWERLKEWVDEEAESSELYNRITESALLFEQGKAGLWRDPDLQIALDWKEKQKPNESWAVQYNNNFKSSMRFIEASLNEKKFERAERVRKRKLINYSAIAVLVALAMLSLWALTERNNSVKNAQAAIAGKNEADKQKLLAETQKQRAEENFLKAKKGEEKVKEQQSITEQQRKLALKRAEEAKLASQKAEEESKKAIAAKKSAENDRRIAEDQRLISDSLRLESEKSEKQATRLRILATAQNLAIKSKVLDPTTESKDIKALLALQAYKFQKQYGGNLMDVETYSALFSAARNYQNPAEYMHKQHTSEVKSVCYSASNGNLASTGDDGKIVIVPPTNFAAANLSTQQSLLYDHLVYGVKGEQIAVACDNWSLHVYNQDKISEPTNRITGIHKEKVMAIEWLNDQLITACLDSFIRVINLQGNSVSRAFKMDSRPFSMDLHLKSGMLFIGGEDGSISKIDITSNNKFTQLQSFPGIKINCISVNSNGTLIAVGLENGGCHILSAQNGEIVSTLSGHKSAPTHVRFHPFKDYLATSCRDSKVRLYTSLESGTQPVVFAEHTGWVHDVVFNPTGELLASCSKDKTVRTYSISASNLAAYLEEKIPRNLTLEEWKAYVGTDVPYEKTKENL